MKRILIALCTIALGAVITLDAADAARLGGGRSLGAQRAAPMQRQALPAAPAQQAAKPAAPAQTPQPAAQGNRWLGPLAGLAAGLGLGWLIGQGGFGGMLGSLMMMMLVAAAVVMLLRLFLRPRAATGQPMQYAGLGDETVAAPPPSQMFSGDAGSQPDFRSQFQPQIPAGFDVEGFLKQAKLNFVRLQQANDRGDIETLREVSTEEMFDSIKGDARSGGVAQQTDIVTLNASLLEVVTEGGMHWASVRFAGSLREAPNAAPTDFEEVWNLQKPVNGKTGWLLAGIQQLS